MDQIQTRTRQSLVISSDQLKEEIFKRIQNYLHPDKINGLNNLETIKSYYKCVRCDEIPIDIELCEECDEIVCKPCQTQIQNSAKKNKDQKKCPSKDCPNPSTFKFGKLKFKQSIRIVKELSEFHLCKIEFQNQTPVSDDPQNQCSDNISLEEVKLEEDPTAKEAIEKNNIETQQLNENTSVQTLETTLPDESLQPQFIEHLEGKRYNIFELAHHLDNECPRNRTCFQCMHIFKNKDEFYAHLKFSCEHVLIECNVCNKEFTRKDFILHQCFISQTLMDLNLPYLNLAEVLKDTLQNMKKLKQSNDRSTSENTLLKDELQLEKTEKQKLQQSNQEFKDEIESQKKLLLEKETTIKDLKAQKFVVKKTSVSLDGFIQFSLGCYSDVNCKICNAHIPQYTNAYFKSDCNEFMCMSCYEKAETENSLTEISEVTDQKILQKYRDYKLSQLYHLKE